MLWDSLIGAQESGCGAGGFRAWNRKATLGLGYLEATWDVVRAVRNTLLLELLWAFTLSHRRRDSRRCIVADCLRAEKEGI